MPFLASFCKCRDDYYDPDGLILIILVVLLLMGRLQFSGADGNVGRSGQRKSSETGSLFRKKPQEKVKGTAIIGVPLRTEK